MIRGARNRKVLAPALVALLVAATFAVTIYENLGVGTARLGMYDRSAASRLGMTYRGRDRSYANQVVYKFTRGGRLSNGHFPLEMFSNRYHKVFTFVAYSGSYVTRKGIRVGNTERYLKQRYGSALRHVHMSSGYTRYYLGSRTGTDFYVRYGRVKRIVVRTY